MLSNSKLVYLAIKAFKHLHPVRAEQMNTRDLDFSKWMREYGRPSKTGCTVGKIEIGGFVPTDVDWVLYDYKHRILRLLEVKTRGGYVRFAQQSALDELNGLCLMGAEARGVRYMGLSVLRLQNSTPTNSAWREWDGERITTEECWRRINLLDAFDDFTAVRNERR